MTEMPANWTTRLKTLEEGARALGVSLSTEALTRCIGYLTMLVKWNRVYNLTAIRDPDDMTVQHLLDSLSIVPLIRGQRLLDIGSGAGLPGIPIAISRADVHVTVLDSNQKKCAFMQQAVSELQLKNVTVAWSRIEDLPQASPTAGGSTQGFDTITSRAFAELAEFVKVALPLLAPQGLLLAMKGLKPDTEIEGLADRVSVSEVRTLQVPGLDAARCAILMERPLK